MQNCKEVLALLSEYLDLDLPAEECQEIERHLAGCSPCEEFAQSLRKTVDLCRAYRPGVMPGPLSAQARNELEMAWRRMREVRAEMKEKMKQ